MRGVVGWCGQAWRDNRTAGSNVWDSATVCCELHWRMQMFNPLLHSLAGSEASKTLDSKLPRSNICAGSLSSPLWCWGDLSQLIIAQLLPISAATIVTSTWGGYPKERLFCHLSGTNIVTCVSQRNFILFPSARTCFNDAVWISNYHVKIFMAGLRRWFSSQITCCLKGRTRIRIPSAHNQR